MKAICFLLSLCILVPFCFAENKLPKVPLEFQQQGISIRDGYCGGVQYLIAYVKKGGHHYNFKRGSGGIDVWTDHSEPEEKVIHIYSYPFLYHDAKNNSRYKFKSLSFDWKNKRITAQTYLGVSITLTIHGENINVLLQESGKPDVKRTYTILNQKERLDVFAKQIVDHIPHEIHHDRNKNGDLIRWSIWHYKVIKKKIRIKDNSLFIGTQKIEDFKINSRFKLQEKGSYLILTASKRRMLYYNDWNVGHEMDGFVIIPCIMKKYRSNKTKIVFYCAARLHDTGGTTRWIVCRDFVCPTLNSFFDELNKMQKKITIKSSN